MEEIIKLDSVDLIYQSAESLSIKKAIKMLLTGKIKRDLLMRYKALNNISFSIKKGNVYGIIGNNGAGKSTLLRILSGAMSPTSGTIERKYATINLLALGVGFTKDLTGYENIFLNGMILGFSKKIIKEKLDDIIAYSELGDFIYKPMKTYSSGMVSRLGFSIAINLKPEVLLVDEILSVGDVKFREKSFNSIRKYIEDENTTVVIVSHSMQQIKDLCNYVIWLEKGNLIAKGDTNIILDAYSKVSKECITLEEARREVAEKIRIDNRRIYLDISNYQLCLEHAKEKRLFGRIYEYCKTFKLENTVLSITTRRLHNDDMFIYFTVEGEDEIRINLRVDEVKDRLHFDNYYKKPIVDDPSYENIETGPNSFLDLKSGAMMISKIMHFDDFDREYKYDRNLQLLKLISESNNVKLMNSNEIEVTIPYSSSKASFFIVLSKAKLFRSFSNMKAYMEYYFTGIENNVNKSPFFQLPSGTFTKICCDAFPSVRNIYGYTLTNVWNLDYIQFYQSTNERFFLDLMTNAVLQAFLYRDKKEEIFLTKDTTVNCNTVQFLSQFQSNNPLRDRIIPIKDFDDFYFEAHDKFGKVYEFDEGTFFPEHISEEGQEKIRGKLVDQIYIARFLLEGYLKYADIRYRDLAEQILLFMDKHKTEWMSAKTGDLYQYFSYNTSSKIKEFSKRDSIYITLKELLQLQEVYTTVYGKKSESIDYLIDVKMAYLKGTVYDVYNEDAPAVIGEGRDIRADIRKLYDRLRGIKDMDLKE